MSQRRNKIKLKEKLNPFFGIQLFLFLEILTGGGAARRALPSAPPH
jgi:hypothetical protein